MKLHFSPRNNDHPKIKFIYSFFVVLFIILAARISYLQIFRRAFFKSLSQNQYYRLVHLEGNRGKIFDRRSIVLARGMNTYSIFADPSVVTHPDDTAEILSLNLNLPQSVLKRKLGKKNRFVWIKRKVSWEKKERIRLLRLGGVGFIREEKRVYPQGGIASSVLGIVDIDNKGLEGLELFYDQYLQGKDGWVQVLQDSRSREVILNPQILAPQQGADIFLTLDAQIQYWVQKYTKAAIKDFSAKGGSAVVMDARTGGVLALVSCPSSNADEAEDIFSVSLRNVAIADYFEPGSVFKVVTLLGAVAEGEFADSDKFFCENGRYKIPGSILHDWRPYGELTFKEVFKKSSNIGVAKIAHSLGKEKIYFYIKKLGFGEKTGVDLPGESPGSVKPVSLWSKTSEYIIPIGQEVGVSLMQLVRAFAVIANGGYLVKPHLVKTIRSSFFNKDILGEKKRVISSSVARRVKEILIEVVNEGTGRKAAVLGLSIGGKTGTAQKYDRKLGRYSPDKYRATFVGFLSDFNPPLVIGITIDEPKRSHFGGVVAAPLFKRIAREVSSYLEREKALGGNN